MDDRITCCLCGVYGDSVNYVVSTATSNAVCEPCIEQAKIAVRTRQAVVKKEYGIL